LACAWALHAGHEFVHGEFAVVIFVEGFEGGGGVFDFFLGEFAVFVFVEGFHEGERHHAALTAIGRSAWVGRAAVGRAAWAGRRGAGLWWGRGGVLGAGEAEGGGEDDGGEDPCVHGWMGVVGGLEVTDMGGFRGGAGADRESESGVDCEACVKLRAGWGNWVESVDEMTDLEREKGLPVLVIDDDHKLCRLIADYLEPLGYVVTAVHRGPEGAAAAVEQEWHAVILDFMLPGMDGLEVLRRIRAQTAVPVLMFTARGDEADRIVGLELGADDYLPKTYSSREMLAR
jgi:hypothetical protein